jgi:nitrate/nitrite-specific signal transduction histidine kinase
MLSEEKDELERRLGDAEHNYSSLVALFIASTRLHASRDYVSVVRTVGEILTNLVGVEAFAIFVSDTEKDRLVLLQSTNCDRDALAMAETTAQDVLESGQLELGPTPSERLFGEPLAAVPLRVDDQALGVIVVTGLLHHKEELSSEDVELLELLSANAASALHAARVRGLMAAESRFGARAESADLTPPPIMLSRKTSRPQMPKVSTPAATISIRPDPSGRRNS